MGATDSDTDEGGLNLLPEHEDADARVRVPLFPTYEEVRRLLTIWDGRPRQQVTGLEASLRQLTGTPQNTVDWSDPDTWIADRLAEEDRDLAEAIWTRSSKTINPRHTYGAWLLSQRYRLMQEQPDGRLALTETGRDFVEHEAGATELALDAPSVRIVVASGGENLVKRLLEEMDYENVEVTTRSGDGGVDVVADIELGISSVREVVQAKRHRRAIQRKALDALRGSLYRACA